MNQRTVPEKPARILWQTFNLEI